MCAAKVHSTGEGGHSVRRSIACMLVVLGSLLIPTVSTAHCGNNDAGSNAHDPFGSCETNQGDVRCGADATDATVAKLSTAGSGYGAQACNDTGDVPVWGRAGVWTDGSSIVVGVDADKDTAPSNGWTRLDAGTAGCAHLRRGDSNGSYYTAGGGTTSTNGGLDERHCL